MNTGNLIITFDDPITDAEVEMSFTLMSPDDAVRARAIWMERFALLHIDADFDYTGPDYEGIWEGRLR